MDPLVQPPPGLVIGVGATCFRLFLSGLEMMESRDIALADVVSSLSSSLDAHFLLSFYIYF